MLGHRGDHFAGINSQLLGGAVQDALVGLVRHEPVDVGDLNPGGLRRGDDGGGVVATNKWTEADGDHYFTWVTTPTGLFGTSSKTDGWEYVIPAQGPGTRRVYNELRTAKGPDGVIKTTSKPAYTCPLVPSSKS